MLAHLIDALLERNSKVAPEEVEDVVVGAANHVGEQDGNLPASPWCFPDSRITTAGMTINRFCSSGIAIDLDRFEPDRFGPGPGSDGGRRGLHFHAQSTDAGEGQQNKRLLEEKPAIFMAMGNTAEVVARRYQVTREMQDVYALQSQKRYAMAQEDGRIAKKSSRWWRTC